MAALLYSAGILGALAILVIAGAFSFALLRARKLKARHLRVLSASIPSLDSLGAEGHRVYSAEAALYHGTRFSDGEAYLGVALREPCVGDLFCTEQAVFLKREPGAPAIESQPMLVWPIAWIEEASLHRGFAPLAGKDLPLLRLRWKRGGEELFSELSLRGGMEQLERLRREIHLRQESGKALLPLVQLGKLQIPPP